MLGVSYDGWLTVMALNEPHPALKAASPQASPADMFLGDDFHHNGAFRLSYGFEYAAMMEAGKDVQQFKFDQHDTYEWFLELGPLSTVNTRYLHGKIPTWNDFVAHHSYDPFWQKQAAAHFLTRPKVPTLNVAGWWDQEDFYGPLKIYETWEKNDAERDQHDRRRAVEPWRLESRHRRSSRPDQVRPAHLLAVSREDRGPIFRALSQGPAARSRQGNRPGRYFRQGECGPARRLSRSDQFSHRRQCLEVVRPLATQGGGRPQALHCGPAAGSAFEPPPAAANGQEPSDFDEYISDPARPVPYYPRPISALYLNSQWPEWLVQDQRFAHLRPDVLSYETEPLTEDLDVAGTGARAVVCLDQRDRLRLDRQAHRRLPRRCALSRSQATSS